MDYQNSTVLTLYDSPDMLRPWDLEITIDVNCERAVYIQIADAIIAAIKTGKLHGGDALPGSRQLALKLKVNRNTIIEALDVLTAEGWLVSKERRGTFIADSLSAFRTSKRDNEKPNEKIVNKSP